MKKFNEIDVFAMLQKQFPYYELGLEVTKNKDGYEVVDIDNIVDLKIHAMDFALPFEHIEFNNNVLKLGGEVRMCYLNQLLITVDEIKLAKFISNKIPTHYVGDIIEKNKFIQTLDYDVRNEIECKVSDTYEDGEFEHNSIRNSNYIYKWFLFQKHSYYFLTSLLPKIF